MLSLHKYSIIAIAIILVSTMCVYASKKIDHLVHLIKGKLSQHTTRHLHADMKAGKFPFVHSTYQRKYHIEKPIVIIIPSFNNAKWLDQNLDSIRKQINYSNVRIIYITDGCESEGYDGTGELVENYIIKHNLQDKIKLIKNKERHGALYNLYHAIHSGDDHEIVITVDGDDALYHDQVLVFLNDIYSGHDVWMTHGSFIEFPTGYRRWSENIPAHIITANQFRSFKCASHLRTFYAGLFKQIKYEDLQYHNKFYWMTWDQAMMFPMCEMAGKHQIFLDTLYVYNTANQINDWKVDAQLQRDLETHIRALPAYQPLQSLY